MPRIGYRSAVVTAVVLSWPAGATMMMTAIQADSPTPLPPVDWWIPDRPGPFIIFFAWNKADISPSAARILDNAVGAFQGSGWAQLLVNGYADRSGSSDYNIALSQRRAEIVRDYLIRRGVPSSAIVTEANGENRPLVETADGKSHPHNRRVEIYIR